MKLKEDKCSVKGCGKEPAVMYLGKDYCSKHWSELCDKEMEESNQSKPDLFCQVQTAVGEQPTMRAISGLGFFN